MEQEDGEGRRVRRRLVDREDINAVNETEGVGYGSAFVGRSAMERRRNDRREAGRGRVRVRAGR